eukprot:446518-Rhodomonas_salina.2
MSTQIAAACAALLPFLANKFLAQLSCGVVIFRAPELAEAACSGSQRSAPLPKLRSRTPSVYQEPRADRSTQHARAQITNRTLNGWKRSALNQ